MAWLLLIFSGLTDVAWAFATKRSDGFTNPWWNFLSLILLALFVTSLAKALAVLPLGTAYIVWTGIGAVGAFCVGIFLLGESVAPFRLLFAGITLVGILGLKAAG